MTFQFCTQSGTRIQGKWPELQSSQHRRRTFKGLLNCNLKSRISRHLDGDVNSTEAPASIATRIRAERQGKHTKKHVAIDYLSDEIIMCTDAYPVTLKGPVSSVDSYSAASARTWPSLYPIRLSPLTSTSTQLA